MNMNTIFPPGLNFFCSPSNFDVFEIRSMAGNLILLRQHSEIKTESPCDKQYKNYCWKNEW